MNNSHNKTSSAYHMMKYILGLLVTVFIVFIVAYMLFSCSSETQTARLQQHENVIAAIGNVNDPGVIPIQ